MTDIGTMSLDDLRIAVAIQMFDWTWHKHPTKDIFCLRPPNGGNYGAIRQGDLIEYTHYLPDYARDIAAAWLVVEKLKYVSIYAPKAAIVQEYENEFDDEWGCEIKPYKDAPVWESVDGRGATAPEAICRAALKAVRSNDD